MSITNVEAIPTKVSLKPGLTSSRRYVPWNSVSLFLNQSGCISNGSFTAVSQRGFSQDHSAIPRTIGISIVPSTI